MSKLSQMIAEKYGATIVTIVSTDVVNTRRWKTLGQDLHADGITVAMLTTGTEKEPNDRADDDVITTVMGFILAGVTRGNPGYRFPFAPPSAKGVDQTNKKKLHVWTAEQVVSLDRSQMDMIPKTIEGNEFRTARNKVKTTANQMMKRVIRYIDEFENPDKQRAEKQNKKGDAKQTDAVYNNIGAHLAHLTAMMAARNSIGLTAAEADAYGNTLEESIVLMRAAKSKADKLAK